MEKTIYLPEYAKERLETSDNASVWSKPIPYKEKPEEGFTLKTILNDDTLDIPDVIEKGNYYPDRDQALTDVIETMEIVKVPKKTINKSEIKKNKNTIYRCFQGMGGDSECWAKYDGQQITKLLHHTFSIYSPEDYFQGREKMLDKILEEGAGIIINRQEIRLPDNYNYFDNKSKKYFPFNSKDRKSIDGIIYKLFSQHDGGRGWSLLAVKENNHITADHEDHVDNVRDFMLSEEFLKSYDIKINLKYLDRINHDFYTSQYAPNIEHFKKDFNINERGKKIKIK